MPKKQPLIEKPNSSTSRPPIVVVMGHVDHGKTSLLDAIRSADVASGEHGGITQSIGAYQVTVNGEPESTVNLITFIDTPGHLAFTKMRSHGAKVADIAVLVVAANDSVMPQTVESIKIIQDAKIPFVVAINKMDLPEANFDKVVQDLLKHGVLLENYGGDVPFIKVSAKKKEGIKELLELLDLMWEMQEIKSDPAATLEAIVIESKLDKNRGPIASVVVRNGTLRAGQKIYIDAVESKIRGLFNYLQKPITEALPGTPVEIIGLAKVPPTGAAVSNTLIAQEIPENKRALATNPVENQLNVVIKADTLGSLEAILASLPTNVTVLEAGVGDVNANDILTAKNTKSIVLGFNNSINPAARNLMETEKVLVRTYKIIYELLDEISDAAAGMLEINQVETLGKGQILAEFPFNGLKIAGTKVLEGRLARGDLIKLMRGKDTTVGESKVKSVRLGREEITKVEAGKECGVLLDPQLDFLPGDILEAFKKY